jgi:hypothetical protein
MVSAAILGTWELVSAASSTSGGKRDETPFGQNPAGFLTYTQDGRMTAMISFGGRKRLSPNNLGVAPVEEQAEAYRTFVAYAGRYTLNSENVIHHVEISSIQDWAGTDLLRSIKFEGERIILAALPAPADGDLKSFELIWQRLPASSR